MSNNTEKKPQTKKKAPASTQAPKEVHLGDGVLDAAKSAANERAQQAATTLVHKFWDWVENKIAELPDQLKALRDNPEAEDEIASLWSEILYEQGAIPKGYCGLPDDLLIHNFHQDGYIEGMYVGYLITLVTLAEAGISKQALLDARKDILPQFLGKGYEERIELCQELKGIMEKWSEDNDSGSESK